jgi:hypothetical protein
MPSTSSLGGQSIDGDRDKLAPLRQELTRHVQMTRISMYIVGGGSVL